MLLENVDYPDRLIEALKDGKLVVFAGAGVSMGDPTNLPDFNSLAEQIAYGTGEQKKKSEPCEVFLGKLTEKGIAVHNEAAKILSTACVEHNVLHETIINLFPRRDSIKIVTTNFDQMFEKALKSQKIATSIFNAPALPLGDDIQGIIHVHGNVENPKKMIITDEDFGKAYLSEGYASRFLVKLFETYTILFVGYSYNDTILRYLSRAMLKNNVGNRFILTDHPRRNWSMLGITPVQFSKDDYEQLQRSLVKLGDIAKRGLTDWQARILEIGNRPTREMIDDTEIEYYLSDFNRSRVLAKGVHGKYWLQILDERKVFDNCFTEEIVFSERDELWCNWLEKEFLGKDDKTLFDFIFSHKSVLNRKTAENFARAICSSEGIEGETLVNEYSGLRVPAVRC